MFFTTSCSSALARWKQQQQQEQQQQQQHRGRRAPQKLNCPQCGNQRSASRCSHCFVSKPQDNNKSATAAAARFLKQLEKKIGCNPLNNLNCAQCGDHKSASRRSHCLISKPLLPLLCQQAAAPIFFKSPLTRILRRQPHHHGGTCTIGVTGHQGGAHQSLSLPSP